LYEAGIFGEYLCVFFDEDSLVSGSLSDGGLKCFGHPVGASGIRMLYEVYNQLMGRADGRQLDSPKLGLAHGVGGTPIDSSTGAVVILGTPD